MAEASDTSYDFAVESHHLFTQGTAERFEVYARRGWEIYACSPFVRGWQMERLAALVAHLDTVWSSDITYVSTQEGWLYLAVVLDLSSWRVVGWHMAAILEDTLVVRALEVSYQKRHPAAGLLHHSDRSSPYASRDFQGLLTQYGMVCSMSGQGNCYDNAPVEGFFATLKREWIHQHGYGTREEAKTSIFDCLEVFYNRQRRHAALGYLSPVAYERQQPLAVAA